MDLTLAAARGRHRPHEVLLLAVSVYLGVIYAVGAPPPGSLSALLPLWIFKTWAVVLLLSGVFGLVGCFWPWRADVGLEVERGALVMQTGGLLLYTAVVFTFAGWPAMAAGAITVAWAIANGVRAAQVTRLLRPLKGAL